MRAMTIEADPPAIPLPDVRRLDRMPSWPAWVELPLASLKRERQPDKNGKWRETPTLPASLMLTAKQREALERHRAALDALCDETPENSAEAEACVLLEVTKMMLVLPSQRPNEPAAEARGEAYMMALDDVPPWAVRAAFRRWYRGDVGNDEKGQPYDCTWAPQPCDLRRVARAELWRVCHRAFLCGELLAAEQRIEFSDEHCDAMRARLDQLFKFSPVGVNGSGEAPGIASGESATVGPDRAQARPEA